MSEIDSILQATATTKALRTYAYLQSSVRGQKGTADTLRCLLPIVIAGLREQPAGVPIDDVRLQASLKTFGLSIPLFVLKQFDQPLIDAGMLEWRGSIKKHVIKPSPPATAVPGARTTLPLEDIFDTIEPQLLNFARSISINAPHSASWTDALVAYLKSDTVVALDEDAESGESDAAAVVNEAAAENAEPMKIRNTLLGKPEEAERYVVASFIRQCKTDGNRATLDGIVQVYTGILIEEFVTTVQATGLNSNFRGLALYYDTNLLLRLLGTSGKVYQAAMQETHNSLKALGCKFFFLPSTRSEVQTILNGVAEDKSNPYWETAEALDRGDITRSGIQELAIEWQAVLAEEPLGILPLEFKDIPSKGPSIREYELAKELNPNPERDPEKRTQADKRTQNDARSIGTIVRLRKGFVTDQVGSCKHLFISRNAMVQRTARKFMMDDLDHEYEDESIPPALTLTQIATIAWLVEPQKLEPAKLSLSLLARCYNAVRPRNEWRRHYMQIIRQNQQKSPAFANRIANNAMLSGTLARLVKDATIGLPEVLDRLGNDDFAALIAQAERTADELTDELERTRYAAASAAEALREAEKTNAAERRLAVEKLAEAHAALQEAEDRRLAAEEQARLADIRVATPSASTVESKDAVDQAQSPIDPELTNEDRRADSRPAPHYSWWERLDPQTKAAITYVGFGLFSLAATALLFGVLQSTGALSLAAGPYVKSASFGGAFAGFYAVFWLMMRSYHATDRVPRLCITGNVVDGNGTPVQGATVYVAGWDREIMTNGIGHFDIEVPEGDKWSVQARKDNTAAEVTVEKKTLARPVILRLKALPKTRNPPSSRASVPRGGKPNAVV